MTEYTAPPPDVENDGTAPAVEPQLSPADVTLDDLDAAGVEL